MFFLCFIIAPLVSLQFEGKHFYPKLEIHVGQAKSYNQPERKKIETNNNNSNKKRNKKQQQQQQQFNGYHF